MPEKLSEALVRKALPPARGQTMICDTEMKGFALCIIRAGSKAFVLDYRIEGRQRRGWSSAVGSLFCVALPYIQGTASSMAARETLFT